jgi:hypothetical protein
MGKNCSLDWAKAGVATLVTNAARAKPTAKVNFKLIKVSFKK